jgi:predicted RNA-binding protein Jag
MAYTITIRLQDREVRPDEAKAVVNYLNEVLARMGYSYQIECQKDGMRMMMGLHSPQVQD